MANYAGTATFFNNCDASHRGACGTCYSDQGGVAYPHLVGFPGDYSAGCVAGGGMVALHCGDYITLGNFCSGQVPYLFAPIVDHGPGAACTLDTLCGIPTSFGYRLLDLTPVTYANIGGDPLAGHVAVNIATP